MSVKTAPLTNSGCPCWYKSIPSIHDWR